MRSKPAGVARQRRFIDGCDNVPRPEKRPRGWDVEDWQLQACTHAVGTFRLSTSHVPPWRKKMRDLISKLEKITKGENHVTWDIKDLIYIILVVYPIYLSIFHVPNWWDVIRTWDVGR
ncbi:MAG: hypothetical protein ACXADY_26360 [Candidatus Hodarchaeales archaeon]